LKLAVRWTRPGADFPRSVFLGDFIEKPATDHSAAGSLLPVAHNTRAVSTTINRSPITHRTRTDHAPQNLKPDGDAP
jgi:hypothetical protein